MDFFGLLDGVPRKYRWFFLMAAAWTVFVVAAGALTIGLTIGFADWARTDVLALAEVFIALAGVGWVVVVGLGVARSLRPIEARLSVGSEQEWAFLSTGDMDTTGAWEVWVRNPGDREATSVVLRLWGCELEGFDADHWQDDHLMPGGVSLRRIDPLPAGHLETVCTVRRPSGESPGGFVRAGNVEHQVMLNGFIVG